MSPNCFIVSAFVPGKILAKRGVKRAKGYFLPRARKNKIKDTDKY